MTSGAWLNPIDIHYAAMRERRYQTAKWGTLDEHPLPVPGYLLVIGGELDEAVESWRKGNDADALREILQVLATCYACLEQHGIVERDT